MTEKGHLSPTGTENVVSDYLDGYHQMRLDEVTAKLRKTRNIIFAVAGLMLVTDLVIYAMNDTPVRLMWPSFLVVAISRDWACSRPERPGPPSPAPSSCSLPSGF